LKSIIFFLFLSVAIYVQNKPVGTFEHRYFTDGSYDGFSFGQIFTLQLNQDNTYALVEDIENDIIEEPNKITELYTYNNTILTLQTPIIQTFKVNKKMTELKSVKKTKRSERKFGKFI